MTFKGGSEGAKRGHAPRNDRKWHKIYIFLNVTRKQSNFCLQKFGLYYLLGRNQVKSDYFSEIGAHL